MEVNRNKLIELIIFKKIKHYDNWDMYYLLSSLGYPTMFEHYETKPSLDHFIHKFNVIILRTTPIKECNERIVKLLSFKVEDTYHVKLNVLGEPTNYTSALTTFGKSKSKSNSKSQTRNKSRNDNIRNCGRYRRNFCGKRILGDDIFIHYGNINYNVAGLADVYDYPGLLSVKPIKVNKTRKITTPTIEGPGDPRDKEATDYEKLMNRENIFTELGSHLIDRSDELPSIPLLDTEISMITFPNGWRVKGIINSKHKIVICNEIVDAHSIASKSKLSAINFSVHIHPFNINDLAKYYNANSKFTKDFYDCIRPTTPYFLDGLKHAKKVRLIALCHGCISEPFIPPVKIRRISATVPGICGLTQFNHKIKTYHLFESIKEDDPIFIRIARKITHEHIQTMHCVKNWNKLNINQENRTMRNRMYDVCTKLETVPNKTYDKMFNKSFGNERGLNFLLIGFETEIGYKYINLFSLVDDIDLKTILSDFTPNCKNLIFVDMSCSITCSYNYNPSEEDLATYG